MGRCPVSFRFWPSAMPPRWQSTPRGAQRACAAGFLLGNMALLTTIQFAPEGAPIGRVVEANSSAPTIQFPPQIYAPPSVTSGGSQGVFRAVPYGSAYSAQAMIVATPYSAPIYSPIPNLDGVVRLRAANAVAAMLADLAGSLLAALAYRQCRAAPEAS
jgi:hypothetical protein